MFRQRGGLDAILHRPQRSIWSEFLSQPFLFLARKIYAYRVKPEAEPRSPITVICISDTHNCQPVLPDGDILIHAGDLTQSGSLSEIQAAVDWLKRQPHRHKVIIAGNHDLILDSSFEPSPSGHRQEISWGDVVYLQHSSITLHCSHSRSIKIYGSPLSPRHGNWAFQYPRTTNVWENAIPSDTDILITHAPPKGHLDLDGFGCQFLMQELWKLSNKPRLHVFGHVHEGYGVEHARFDDVQRAYDDFILSNGGIARLLYLFYAQLRSVFSTQRNSPTWLINASAVGGLRDDKRRKPITVNI